MHTSSFITSNRVAGSQSDGGKFVAKRACIGAPLVHGGSRRNKVFVEQSSRRMKDEPGVSDGLRQRQRCMSGLARFLAFRNARRRLQGLMDIVGDIDTGTASARKTVSPC